MPEGVDLYEKYNKITSWSAIRAADVTYAWIKVSDGNTNRDDVGYVAKGRSVGLLMGGYHYAQPGDAVAQANRLCDRVEALGATQLAPALDLEDPFVPNMAAVNFAIAFLKQVERRGHVPCLYANNAMLAFVQPRVKAAMPQVKIWAARYGATPSLPYDVHQYSSTGRVNGIVGDVDRNRGNAILNNRTEEDDMTPAELLGAQLNYPDGTPITLGDALRRIVANTEALPDIKATGVANAARLAALQAALEAATNDPDITLAEIEEVVEAAVKANLPALVNVEVKPAQAAK